MLSEKESYSNYLGILNEYYDKIFKIPEKLKKQDKGKRNDKLREYLNKFTNSFFNNHRTDYLHGIIFPIDGDSSVVSYHNNTEC